jgi:hypothetical protein
MSSHFLAAGCIALLAVTARAQDLAAQPATTPPQGTPPPAPLSSGPPVTPPAEVERPKWTFGLSAYQYFLEHGGDYLQTTLTADRGELHLEARHNYEGIDTTSTWVGWNTTPIDEEVALQLTPMIGYAFGGHTEGPGLGYRGALSWKKLELYSEGEYLFDAGDQSGDFFYNWSELTLSPTDWFRFGVVAQRTRTWDSNLDIQRGLLVGFHFKRLDLSTQVFNLDQDHPTYVVSANFGL